MRQLLLLASLCLCLGGCSGQATTTPQILPVAVAALSEGAARALKKRRKLEEEISTYEGFIANEEDPRGEYDFQIRQNKCEIWSLEYQFPEIKEL